MAAIAQDRIVAREACPGGATITPAAPASITAFVSSRRLAKPGLDTPTTTGTPVRPARDAPRCKDLVKGKLRCLAKLAQDGQTVDAPREVPVGKLVETGKVELATSLNGVAAIR